MMTSSELVRRVKKLEEMLAPAREPIEVSVVIRFIGPGGIVTGERTEQFTAGYARAEPDHVVHVAPHFAS